MNTHRFAAWISISAVAIAIVAALVFIGSPAEQRQLRLDAQRVDDLTRLASAVNRYWDERGALPASADELVDGRRLTRLPLDPSTDQPYEYRVIDMRRFELCATFTRRSREEDTGDFWFHEAGRRCFSFDTPAR
jgi:hypothetical protein